MMRRSAPVVLDVDTGVDDAVAIVLAAHLPELELLALTTVAGNVSIDHTTENSLRVLSAIGKESIPVYRGMSAPLARAARDAATVHGDNGLGGVELPVSVSTAQATSAPEYIVRTARERPGELTLVCVGPLTNLAVALLLEPDLPELLPRVVIMGGAFVTPGNVTRWAEFNIWADPEAGSLVARSGLPCTFIGLDVTHQTVWGRTLWERLEDSSQREHQLLFEILRHTFVERGRDAFILHDPLAVAVAVKPDLITMKRSTVAVDTGAGASVGQTLMTVDPLSPQHHIARDVDTHTFHEVLAEALHLPA